MHKCIFYLYLNMYNSGSQMEIQFSFVLCFYQFSEHTYYRTWQHYFHFYYYVFFFVVNQNEENISENVFRDAEQKCFRRCLKGNGINKNTIYLVLARHKCDDLVKGFKWSWWALLLHNLVVWVQKIWFFFTKLREHSLISIVLNTQYSMFFQIHNLYSS